MKRYVAAFLAAGSLVAVTTTAQASPRGVGGGSHPAQARAAVHFVGTTNRWGPNLGQTGTTTIGIAGVDQQTIKCPCTAVFDPFKTEVGGVPKDLKTELKQGVADQTAVDQGRFIGVDPITAAREVDLMNAVWGANFDPHAPPDETADNGQQAR